MQESVPAVRTVQPPPESAIAEWYKRADLLDSYAVMLPPGAPRDPRVLARAALATQPGWARGLMTVRDGAMRRLGVATSGEIGRVADGRDRIGFFPVMSVAPSEIAVGYDDKHLDFRTSIAVVGEEGGDFLVVTTAVRCHNLLGRAYLLAIRPFHVAIVRSGLRRAAALPPTIDALS